MAWDLIANVVISGVLTGLVYGLMALGLSVIFGVVRVVNFAHGEMMTIAMYAAVVLFAALKLDPFLAIVPVAAAFFAFGYAMQAGLINPFITRPEHSQFMLLVAVELIMVNGLLLAFGPDARNVQTEYQLESFALGPLLFDKGRVYALDNQNAPRDPRRPLLGQRNTQQVEQPLAVFGVVAGFGVYAWTPALGPLTRAAVVLIPFGSAYLLLAYAMSIPEARALGARFARG